MIYTTTYLSRKIKNTKIRYDHTAKIITVYGKNDWGWSDTILHFTYASLESIQDDCLIFFVANGLGKTLERVFCNFESVE